MNARKVLEMGGGTLLVSLPKSWARKNGVKKGSTVAVDELSGRKLIVRPIEGNEDGPSEVSVEYTGEDLGPVMDDVTGAYLYGYDVIRLGGKRVITREDRVRFKATLSRLIGLEIIDEDSKHITVQFLLEPSAMNPERIVKRMSAILDGMIKDTSEAVEVGDDKLLTLVTERDDEVDRLYFLLVREIRTATIHPEIAETYSLAPMDILDYRVLASFLESAGDAMAELSKKLHGVKLQEGVAKEYASCLSLVREMNGTATQSFLMRRSGRFPEAYARINNLSLKVSESLVRITQVAEAKPAIVETLGALERESKLLVDISDLTVTARLVR
jgi:phosphate uptake regulator